MKNLAFRTCALVAVTAALSACPSNPPDPKDTEAPKVRSINPADGATNVAPGTKITVTFTEDINADTLEVALAADPDGAAVAGSLSVDGDQAVFTPNADLAEGTAFTFTVKAGYQDAAGNAGDESSAKFTTGSGLPTVTATNPADGAQNVPVNTTISAQFSEPMNAESINNQSFFVLDGTNMVAGSIAYDANESLATFTPSSPLFESRTYTATLTTDVRDVGQNHLGASKVWSFTTAATVPTVQSITPANGSTDVPGNAPVKVVFSEAMDPATLNEQTFQVSVQGGSAVAGTYSWEAPTRTATFQPTGAYPGGATIEVKLTTGVKDTSGIALGSEVTASFAISNAPAVASSDPTPNATDVPLTAQVTLTFSQAMDITTLGESNVWIEDDQQVKVTATYVPSGTGLTMVPGSVLTESTVYTVVVTTGVKSATGVNFASEYRYSFTTVGIAPTVVSVDPAPNATDVPVTTKIRITFNEDMDTATFTDANVRLSDGAADVSGTVAMIDLRTVELTPAAPLRELSTYTIIASTGLTDAHGNALPSEFRSTFVTEPLPRIVSISPAPNAQNVPNGAAIVLVANKPLDPATVTITPPTGMPQNTVSLFEENAVIEGAITYDAATRSIRVTRLTNGAPAPWTSGKRYVLSVDGSKLKDNSGNAVGGVITTTFVAGASGDSTAPTVVSMNPQNGQVGVSRQEQPYAVLSEAIDPTSLSSSNVSLKDGSTDLPGRIEYVQAQNRVRFIPDGILPANKQLVFTVGSGIKDPSGNSKSAVNSVTFTTVANTEPSLIAISPADAAMNVNVNTSVRVAFSEPIDPTTLSLSVLDGNTAIAGTVTYDDATASALFRAPSDLPAGKTLTVKIAAGLADKEGLATTAEITRTFSTVANSAKDITKPAVSSSIPANAATGVSGRPVIQLSFSEALDPTSVQLGEFSITEVGGNKVPFGLSYQVASDTASLTPSAPLKAGKTYEVKVQGGLKDLAGNTLDAAAASSTISFTVDASAPTVVTRSPAPNSTVGNSTGVELVFSEDMAPGTIDAASLKLTNNGNPVLAAVWYDAGGRTAFLRPAAKLADATYTVTLDGMRVSDLAGNTVGDTFSFTVSSAGPSIVSVAPCGSTVDADKLGNTVVNVVFDPGVRKTGGGALDGTAIQLKLNGSAVAATVTHTQGASTATLTPSAALQHDQTYEVFIDKNQVQNATTNQNMSSSYSCTFRTQRVIFKDDVDPAQMGWSAPAIAANQWTALNSTQDPGNSTQVWHGGNTADGSNYVRDCATLGGATRTVVLSRNVTLPNLSKLELRLDEYHAMGADADDRGRVVVVFGGNPVQLDSFAGSTSSYAAKTYDLSAYKNATVQLRFELFIDAGNGLNCPAGGKGLYVDNIRIVGE